MFLCSIRVKCGFLMSEHCCILFLCRFSQPGVTRHSILTSRWSQSVFFILSFYSFHRKTGLKAKFWIYSYESENSIWKAERTQYLSLEKHECHFRAALFALYSQSLEIFVMRWINPYLIGYQTTNTAKSKEVIIQTMSE